MFGLHLTLRIGIVVRQQNRESLARHLALRLLRRAALHSRATIETWASSVANLNFRTSSTGTQCTFHRMRRGDRRSYCISMAWGAGDVTENGRPSVALAA